MTPRTAAGRALLDASEADDDGTWCGFDLTRFRAAILAIEAAARTDRDAEVAALREALTETSEEAHHRAYWSDANRTHQQEWLLCADVDCSRYRALLAQPAADRDVKVAALDVERLARAMDAADPPISDTDDDEDHAEHLAYAKEIAVEYARLSVRETAEGVKTPEQ